MHRLHPGKKSLAGSCLYCRWLVSRIGVCFESCCLAKSKIRRFHRNIFPSSPLDFLRKPVTGWCMRVQMKFVYSWRISWKEMTTSLPKKWFKTDHTWSCLKSVATHAYGFEIITAATHILYQHIHINTVRVYSLSQFNSLYYCYQSQWSKLLKYNVQHNKPKNTRI